MLGIRGNGSHMGILLHISMHFDYVKIFYFERGTDLFDNKYRLVTATYYPVEHFLRANLGRRPAGLGNKL